MRTSATRLAMAPALALTLGLSACQTPAVTTAATPSASPNTAAEAPVVAPKMIVGRAVLAAPMVSATLKVIALDGTVVKEFPQATNALGAFAVAAPENLKDFRLEVHPAEDAPAAQKGVAAAEVRDFNPAEDVVYVGLVSTVISHRIKQQPGLSLSDAEKQARITFNLPDGNDLGFDLDDNEYFDEQAFMNSAGGGFDAYVDRVASTLGQPPLLKAPMVKGFVADAGKEIAKKAVMAAGKYLAKKYEDKPVVGWMLNQVFVSAEDKFKEEVNQKLDQIRQELAEQRKLLTEINERLTDLQADVTDIKNQLSRMERVTNRALAINGYNTAIDPLVIHFARLDTLYNQLKAYSMLDPKEVDLDLVKALRQNILNEVPTIVDALFKAESEAIAGRTTAMERWAKVAGLASEGFPQLVDSDYIRSLHEQEEYFATYEALGLILLLEAYHTGHNPQYTLAEQAYNDVIARLDKQKKAVYVPDVTNVHVSPQYGLMWAKKPIEAKPNDIVFTYTRSPRNFAPMEPTAAIKAAKLQGFEDWRLPTVKELITLARDPEKASGIYFSELDAWKFDFGRQTNVIWTSDVGSGNAAVAMDVYRANAQVVGSTVFAILPVRTIPVWRDPDIVR